VTLKNVLRSTKIDFILDKFFALGYPRISNTQMIQLPVGPVTLHQGY